MSYWCYFSQLLNSNKYLLSVHPSFRTKPAIENVIPEASPELSEEDVCFVKLTTTLRLLLFTSYFSLVPMTNLLFLKKYFCRKLSSPKKLLLSKQKRRKSSKKILAKTSTSFSLVMLVSLLFLSLFFLLIILFHFIIFNLTWTHFLSFLKSAFHHFVFFFYCTFLLKNYFIS